MESCKCRTEKDSSGAYVISELKMEDIIPGVGIKYQPSGIEDITIIFHYIPDDKSKMMEWYTDLFQKTQTCGICFKKTSNDSFMREIIGEPVEAPAFYKFVNGRYRGKLWGTSTLKSADEITSKSTTKPTILLVYADWCGHCKIFKPLFNHAMSTDYVFKKIEGSKHPEVLKALGLDVKGFPTLFEFGSRGTREMSREEFQKNFLNTVNPENEMLKFMLI